MLLGWQCEWGIQDSQLEHHPHMKQCSPIQAFWFCWYGASDDCWMESAARLMSRGRQWQGCSASHHFDLLVHAFFCRWDWHVGASLAVRYLPQWQDWGMMCYCFSPPFSINLANTCQLVRKVQPKWSHKCYSWWGSNSDPRSEAAWRVVFLLCFIHLYLHILI